MTAKLTVNPVYISSRRTGNIKCKGDGCSIKPRYPKIEGNTFTATTEYGITKLHTFKKPHKIVVNAGNFTLDNIRIAKGAINQYFGNTTNIIDETKYAEVIMEHIKDEETESRLYICFLLTTAQIPSVGDASYDFWDKITRDEKSISSIEGAVIEIPKPYSLIDILPKTSYFRLSGGEFENFYGAERGVHDFYLFPKYSVSNISQKAFDKIVGSWSNKSIKKRKFKEGKSEDGNDKTINFQPKSSPHHEDSDYLYSSEGLGGMLSSGVNGVITECTEVRDENDVKVSYMDDNKPSKDWFLKGNEGKIDLTAPIDGEDGMPIWIVILIVIGVLVIGLIVKKGVSYLKPPQPKAVIDPTG